MKKIHLSEQLKNVTKISTGTVIGQVVAIVTLPIITRIYGAEIIGIWATINAIANIVQNICDLGISNALMICEEDSIQVLHSIVVKISLLLNIISGIMIFVYYLMIGQDLHYAMMVCLLTAIYAFTLREINTCYMILNRNKQYNILMKNSIIRFSSAAAISIVLGLFGWKTIGYYFGTILGQILTLLHMRRFIPKFVKFSGFNKYKEYIIKYKNFVRFQMPASITVSLRTELPNIMIGALFGNTILGYFSITQKLLTIPVTFLGQSLGKIFYQSISAMRIEGKEIGYFVNHNIKRGMIVAFVPMVLLAAFGDVAITIFFGMEYAAGGVICRIIVYRSLFNFISSATQGIDIVLDKQQYVLYTCFSQTIFAAVSVFIGYYAFDSIYIASVLLVVSFIIVQLWYFCKMYKIMRLRVSEYLVNAVFMIILMLIVSTVLRNGFIFIVRGLNIEFLNHLLEFFVSL